MSLTKLSSYSIATMATLRMVVSGGVLLAPHFMAPLFGLSLTPQATVIARLFGVRDFMIGAYTWKARQQFLAASSDQKAVAAGIDQPTKGEMKRELQRMLWMGIIIDTIDVGSCLISFFDGSIDMYALVAIGAGAALLVDMGILGLRGFQGVKI